MLVRMIRSSYIKSRQAFTLTELAIVLGIIGLIIGGLWVATNTMRENQKIAMGTREIAAIVHNVRELYAERESVTQSGVQSEVSSLIQNSGAFPAEMIQSTTGTVVNPWGGPVALWIDPGNEANVFRISFYNMSQTGCADIASAVGAEGTTSGLVGFGSWYQTTNSSGQSQPYSGSNYTKIAPGQSLDPAVAAQDCQGSPNGTVSAEFDFNFQ